MRAAIPTLLLLLVLAAPAAARPLEPDRTFARDGIFRVDEPYVSQSLIALRDGGTLHVTDNGLMRLGAGGELRGFRTLPGGWVQELVPGLALGSGVVEYGKNPPLVTWALDAGGAVTASHAIDVPGGLAPTAVRRPGGYAALLWTGRERGLLVIALTPDGALDTAWGEDGVRRVPGGDYSDLAIAAARDGSIVVATTPPTRCERVGYTERTERAVLRVQRFTPAGALGTARRFPVGPRMSCPHSDAGEALVDRRGRTVIAGRFGNAMNILRLERDLSRDRSFTTRVELRESWWLPALLERRPGGGYAFGFTSGRHDVPRANVGLVGARGRRLALRRLKVTRNFPTSEVHDIAFDRRGRLVAGGSLRDTDTYIREDYGVPHLAVWRLRTTR